MGKTIFCLVKLNNISARVSFCNSGIVIFVVLFMSEMFSAPAEV